MMSPLSSESLLEGFELVPDTPASAKGGLGVGICLDDFGAASPLQEAYCKQLSEQQYDEQATTETEKALQDLVSFLGKDKSLFRQLMQKRKLEEIEQAGMMSFLKSKLFAKLNGERYRSGLVSEKECETRVQEVSEGIMKAYHYSQESKGQRYNTRQAAKQRARERSNKNTLTPLRSCLKVSFNKTPTILNATPPRLTAPPPPPPCPPPPVLTPARSVQVCSDSPPAKPPRAGVTPLRRALRDSTNTRLSAPNLQRPPIRKKLERADSVKSLHDELISSSPMKRLKSCKNPRSPGGTPVRSSKRLRTSMESLKWETPARLNTPNSEPLTAMLLRMMDQKFKNVRSPSPATPTRFSLPSSPQTGFTP